MLPGARSARAVARGRSAAGRPALQLADIVVSVEQGDVQPARRADLYPTRTRALRGRGGAALPSRLRRSARFSVTTASAQFLEGEPLPALRCISGGRWQTVFGEARCPRAARARASLAFDLEVHRSTSMGPPAVEPSTTAWSVATRVGSRTSTRLRPPPGRRIRPGATGAPGGAVRGYPCGWSAATTWSGGSGR